MDVNIELFLYLYVPPKRRYNHKDMITSTKTQEKQHQDGYRYRGPECLRREMDKHTAQDQVAWAD